MANLVRNLELRVSSIEPAKREVYGTHAVVPEHPKQSPNISERLVNDLAWYHGHLMIVLSFPIRYNIPGTLPGPPPHLTAPDNAIPGAESLAFVDTSMM